jgi:hypothetical protein
VDPPFALGRKSCPAPVPAAHTVCGVLRQACTRTAQIAPRELARLDAHPRSETAGPISVRTLEGRTARIRPDFKFARVVPTQRLRLRPLQNANALRAPLVLENVAASSADDRIFDVAGDKVGLRCAMTAAGEAEHVAHVFAGGTRSVCALSDAATVAASDKPRAVLNHAIQSA